MTGFQVDGFADWVLGHLSLVIFHCEVSACPDTCLRLCSESGWTRLMGGSGSLCFPDLC